MRVGGYACKLFVFDVDVVLFGLVVWFPIVWLVFWLSCFVLGLGAGCFGFDG